MKLLVLKEADRYFRFRQENIEICKMSKASVYPPEQYQLVAENLKQLHENGYPDARIMQLTITETEYTP